MKWVTRFQGAMLLGALLLFAAHAGAAEAGGGGCHSTAITTAAGVTVDVRGFCYEPTVLTVQQGESVTWTNRDPVPHTVTGINSAWGNAVQFSQDQTVSFRFGEPGVYPYVCLLHPMMGGAVSVIDGAAPATVLEIARPESSITQAMPTVLQSDSDSGMQWLLAGAGFGLILGIGPGIGWSLWRRPRADAR